MSIAEFQRIKLLESENILLKARLEKIEAYIWGEEANDTLETLEHATVPHRTRGRPRKEAAV